MTLMNNRILAIVVGLVIVLGAGGILIFSRNSGNNNQNTTNGTSVPTQTAGGQTTSLVDILAMGKNQQCTFSANNTDSATTGVIYLSSSSKIRTNLETSSNNKKSTINMIRVGDDNYIWGDALPTGLKLKLSLSDLSSNTQANQYINPTEKADYKCIPWTVDESVFTPPANVQFSDFGNLIKQGVTGTQNNSNPCDSISDAAAKAACENAMKQ